MPSAFRSSRSGRHLEGPNRTRTGQIDHDVFEGLPVRRWARQPHTFSQAPKTAEENEIGIQGPGGTTTLPELPMPQDSGLLPPISRALLRAARAGCIYIRQSGRSPNEEGKETTDAEDQSTATIHMADRSFTSRKWMTLPKNMEPPEVEFLAKRRPGLPSLYGGTAAVDGGAPGPMRRTKFKKVDPETGNISIYEAWVPEGHRIEGEVTGDVQSIAEQSELPVKPEMPAPGTVVEGVGVVNSEGVVVAEAGSAAVMTPPKRRPPPPKRKGKGIGRGRKKKVMFAPGEGADAATVHGVAPNAEGGVDGVKEGQEGSQMSVDQSGQDEDEEDGEEGDESDEGDETMTDAKTPETPQALSGTESTPQPSTDTPADTKDVDMADGAPEGPPALESPTVAGQDAASQPEAAPALDTSQTDASASAPPAPPAEKAEEAAPERPTDTSEQAVPDQATGEAAPKEESQAPEPTNLPEVSGVDSTVEGEPARHEADMTASEVKREGTPSGVDAGLSAPASAGPEEPKEESSGAEQSVDPTQQPQAEPVSTESEVANLQAPESKPSEVAEPKDDVQMNGASQQPTHTDDFTKPASPAPPTTTTTTTEAEPSVPQPTETEPTGSNTLDDAAPPSDTKAEEAAPESEPAAAQPESA